MANLQIVLLLICVMESTSFDFGSLTIQTSGGKNKVNVDELVRNAGTESVLGERRSRPRLTSKNNKYAVDFLKTFRPVDGRADGNWTKAINCGPPHSKLDLSWAPKVIRPNGKLDVKFSMVAPVSFMNGSAEVTIYVVRESQPTLSIKMDVSCQQIRDLAPVINCPIQKGFPLKQVYETDQLTTLPMGNYVLVLHVYNEKNELFACVNGTLYLQP